MKYMLLVYGDSSTWGTLSDEEAKAELEAFAAFEREASEANVLLTQDALQPDGHIFAKRNGTAQPSEETMSDRRIGCVYVLDARDLAEVSEWAAKVPLVGAGGFDTIEIRPVLDERATR
jgi:hypothetical protein